MRALLDRGHEVTFLTSNTMANSKLSNYTEVLIDPPFDMSANSKYNFFFFMNLFILLLFVQRVILVKQNEFIEKSHNSVITNINILAWFPKMSNAHALENANVQKFIKSTEHQFDVIVAEDFYSDSFLMFAHKYKAPVVTIGMFSIQEFLQMKYTDLTRFLFKFHLE